MDSKLLERVCNAPGASGFEDEVQSVVMDVLGKCCDEVYMDHLCNVIGVKKATRPPAGGEEPIRVLLGAHADEVGMMLFGYGLKKTGQARRARTPHEVTVFTRQAPGGGVCVLIEAGLKPPRYVH